MRLPGTAAIAAAAVFAGMTTIANAQTPGVRNSQQPVGQSVTVVGCLVSESDYRKAHHVSAGELGGAGLGDEFVVVNIGSRTATSGASCSETAGGQAYRVTGKREEELKGHVGKWVEITGTHEKETYNASSSSKLPPEIDRSSFRDAPAMAVVADTPVAAPAPEPAPVPEPVAAPAPPPAPMPTNTPPMDSRGEMSQPPASIPAREALPNTAGVESLIALIGLFCVIAASGMLLAPRRQE
jgi:hypothetical protein